MSIALFTPSSTDKCQLLLTAICQFLIFFYKKFPVNTFPGDYCNFTVTSDIALTLSPSYVLILFHIFSNYLFTKSLATSQLKYLTEAISSRLLEFTMCKCFIQWAYHVILALCFTQNKTFRMFFWNLSAFELSAF